MEQVCPVFGLSPVPTFVSSYSRPDGVLIIFDSFFSAGAGGFAFSCAGAGAVQRTAATPERRRDASFFIVRIFLSSRSAPGAAAESSAASRPQRAGRRGRPRRRGG